MEKLSRLDVDMQAHILWWDGLKWWNWGARYHLIFMAIVNVVKTKECFRILNNGNYHLRERYSSVIESRYNLRYCITADLVRTAECLGYHQLLAVLFRQNNSALWPQRWALEASLNSEVNNSTHNITVGPTISWYHSLNRGCLLADS